MNTEFIHKKWHKHCALNDDTHCEYFFQKNSLFNELARFGQFIKYTLFKSPFSPHLVPISAAEGPHITQNQVPIWSLF